MEVIVMKKKFVVAVAAVVMAAVMSVSAFAADGVTVSSITGDATGPASEIFVPPVSYTHLTLPTKLEV